MTTVTPVLAAGAEEKIDFVHRHCKLFRIIIIILLGPPNMMIAMRIMNSAGLQVQPEKSVKSDPLGTSCGLNMLGRVKQAQYADYAQDYTNSTVQISTALYRAYADDCAIEN